MIRVSPQPEPARFDAAVRRKGLAFLEGIRFRQGHSLPAGTELPPYWRECLDDLYRQYQGKCAYLAVHFERITGGGTVDHYVPKSQDPALAYEWGNYRLACAMMNSRKGASEDVLDPFTIEDGWFCLEPVSGRIFPNPGLEPSRRNSVQGTIDRLGLDDPGNREMRARHIQEYLNGDYSSAFLQRRSPFVYAEIQRQGLL